MSRRKGKVRISREWLYLRLFEFMLYTYSKEGFTKYKLLNKVPNLPAQRQDRISEIINKMLEEKHIEIIFETSNATYYNITEEGKEWYNEFGKKFKKFSEMIRK